MAWTEFLERYRATEAEVQAYVGGLPLWVNVWRGWMFLIFGTALFFVIWRLEARWLIAVMVGSLFAYNVVAMFAGVGRFPSIALVVFWGPLLLYLIRRWRRLVSTTGLERIYSWWLTASLVTLAVSVAFDTYNVAYSFLRGVP